MLKVIIGGIAVLMTAFMAVYLAGPRQIEAPFHQTQRNARRSGSSSRRRRDEVLEKIRNRTLECMICLETVEITDSVWFCGDCLNAGHINELTIYTNGGGRRCPACRTDISSSIPLRFTCMCGRARNPRANSPRPFSCRSNSCIRCSDECHPGPC